MATIARVTKAGGGTNFNAGQVIDPAEVNDDFNTLFTEINGGLDDENVATASIPGAKSLKFTEIAAPSTPSSNDLLVYAADWAPISATLLHTKDSAGRVSRLGPVFRYSGAPYKEVVSTAAETSIFATAPTIPGGTLGIDGLLVLRIAGNFLNNTAGTDKFTLKIKYGATTVLTFAPADYAISASRYMWQVTAQLGAAGATNAQTAWGYFVSTGTAGAGSGTEVQPTAVASSLSAHYTVAEDSTADKVLDITIQNDTSSANEICRVLFVSGVLL